MSFFFSCFSALLLGPKLARQESPRAPGTPVFFSVDLQRRFVPLERSFPPFPPPPSKFRFYSLLHSTTGALDYPWRR